MRQRFCKLNRYSLPGEIVSECARKKKKSSYQRILANCCQQSPTKKNKRRRRSSQRRKGGNQQKLCGAGSTFFLLGFEDSIPRMMKRRSLFCDTRASPFTLVEWIHKNLSIARYVYLRCMYFTCTHRELHIDGFCCFKLH